MAEPLHPAIEDIDSKIARRADHGAPAVIADHCGNAAFIHGEGTMDWRGLDLATQKATLTASGSGDPLVCPENILSGQGKGLKADDWVAKGSTMGICLAPLGSVPSPILDRSAMSRARLQIDAGRYRRRLKRESR